jgi:dihydroorotate dehydrogenase
MNFHGGFTVQSPDGRAHTLDAPFGSPQGEAKSLPYRPRVDYRIYRALEAAGGKVLLRLPPEIAHWLALQALKRWGRLRPRPLFDEHVLSQEVFGLHFPNPIGSAAGLDKDAQAVDGTLSTGFGFCEVGTLTPNGQKGNLVKPRVDRIRKEEAVVNRFGFNNEGHTAALRRLNRRADRVGIVGVNLGVNKDSIDRVADYVIGINTFAEATNYFVINVSSPNTQGLRRLQEGRNLDDLLARVIDARDKVIGRVGRKPILLKISPDLELNDLDEIVTVAVRRQVDGMIVCNTTTRGPHRLRGIREGGLSGRPLRAVATRLIAETYQRVGSAFPLIGVGGIDSDEAAWDRIRAGATLIQIYTGLIYHFISLIDDVKVGLIERLAAGGHTNISDVIGVDVPDLISEPWPSW